MQNYVVRLESPVSESFRCQKAANSLDIDVKKKSIHELKVSADVTNNFNVGLIVGASGSGKSTLAQHIWGVDCFKTIIDLSRPVIEQFPESWSYDDCAAALSGIGLTSVPCWIRPVATLSTGQRARAEAALQMARSAHDDGVVVIDEWTSVVDRTVAKAMSHCVAKHARKFKKKIVLVACHFDIVEWLNPDWVIDCNTQTYTDRRAMVGAFERTDRLRFDIKEVDEKSWPYFSKYHYLSDRLPGGKIYTFGLFHGNDQIGFQCFAAYIIGNHTTFFSNRTVIHPDYAGLGMGIKLINETSKEMVRRGFDVKAKFSSTPVFRAMSRQREWKLTRSEKKFFTPSLGRIKNVSTKSNLQRQSTMRKQVTTYSFDFVWKPAWDGAKIP